MSTKKIEIGLIGVEETLDKVFMKAKVCYNRLIGENLKYEKIKSQMFF